jgi:GntR family transcriptional regulator
MRCARLVSCLYLIYTVGMTPPAPALRLGPISPAAPGALYQQIVDAFKREIAAERIVPGSPLPSFRALAEELLVSLITVKRAYEELEREGIIYRRQGLGTFVSERGHDRMRASRRAAAREGIAAGVRSGREVGMTDRELQQILREELKNNALPDEKHKEAG